MYRHRFYFLRRVKTSEISTQEKEEKEDAEEEEEDKPQNRDSELIVVSVLSFVQQVNQYAGDV